jgi:hypothetical protein
LKMVPTYYIKESISIKGHLFVVDR